MQCSDPSALIGEICGSNAFPGIIRGTDTEFSDLDLLVDPLPGVTLFDLGAIQIELEASLGVSVDVLTPKDLPRKFRDRVLMEALPV